MELRATAKEFWQTGANCLALWAWQAAHKTQGKNQICCWLSRFAGEREEPAKVKENKREGQKGKREIVCGYALADAEHISLAGQLI